MGRVCTSQSFRPGQCVFRSIGTPTNERAVGPLTAPSFFLPLPDRLSFWLLLPLFAGRAWLYLALNENSLESYLRLFQENLGLLHKYYFKCVLGGWSH